MQEKKEEKEESRRYGPGNGMGPFTGWPEEPSTFKGRELSRVESLPDTL